MENIDHVISELEELRDALGEENEYREGVTKAIELLKDADHLPHVIQSETVCARMATLYTKAIKILSDIRSRNAS